MDIIQQDYCMKKKLIAIILLSIIVIISCKKEKEASEKSNLVTITGKILNFSKSDSIPNLTLYSYNFLKEDPYQENTTAIDDEGNFKIEFKTAYNQVVFFYYKSAASIYVEPNTEIEVTFDGKLKEKKAFVSSLNFNGDLVKENNLLKKYFKNNPLNSSDFYKAFSSKKNPEAIYKLIDSVYYKQQKNYINTFLAENKPSKSLKKWLEIERDIKPITTLLEYAIFYYRPTSTEKPFQDNFPKAYINKINDIPLLDEDSFVNRETHTILPNYYGAYLSKTVKSKYDLPFKKLDSIIYSKEIFKYKNNPGFFKILLFDKLNSTLANNDLSFYQKHKTRIDSTFKKTLYQNYIDKTYIAKKELLENPKLPKDTELLSFSSTDASTFLNEIIKNANGKVVYIDNWATWCGPCKQQFKTATPQLKKEFSKEVDFVYLCHLSDKKLYKPTIAQYNLSGKHYFITKEQNKELVKILNITGYPTYNIIDKKGKVVKTGFEFRPSEPITRKILTKLIKK